MNNSLVAFVHVAFGRCAAVLVLGLGVSLSAMADPVYCYWTGAAGDKSVDTPGNWEDESGNVLETKPGSNAYLVFTDIKSTLTLSTTESSYAFYGYIVRNCTADVILGGSKPINLQLGGVSQESQSGTFWLKYAVTPWNGTNVINVVNENSQVAVENGFNTPNPYADEVVVKRGAGTFLTVNASGSTVNTYHPKFVLEDGVWILNSKTPTLTGTTLVFDGPNGVFDISQEYTMQGVFLEETARATGSSHGFVGSGKMTFKGTSLKNMAFHGCLGGSISLNWNPTTYAKTLTMSEAQHSTVGDLVVSFGTVALTENATFRNLNELNVASGASFSMADGTSVVASKLTVATGSALNIVAGAAFVAKELTVDGISKEPGVYTKQNAGWITGDGEVRIGEQVATWTGGSASTSLTDPANWGGTCPDLTFGSTTLKFPASARVSVPDGNVCRVKGLVLAGANVVLEGTGSIAVGSEGLSTEGDDVCASIGCPVVLDVLEVPMTVGAGCELVFRASGFSAGQDTPDANVTLSGAGTLVFAAGAEPKNLGTFTIASGATAKIAADAGACVTGLKTVLSEGGTLVVCRDYQPGSGFTWGGLVALERGVFGAQSNGSTDNVIATATADLLATGPAAKKFFRYGNNSMSIRNYSETEDARGSMTFDVYTSSKPALTIGATRDSRFSAAVVNSAPGSGVHYIKWAPTNGSVLDVVGTSYDNFESIFVVAKGTIRFSEGAGIKTGGVDVRSGSRMEVAADAGNFGHGAEVELSGSDEQMTVEDGGVLDFPASGLIVKDATVANGCYSSADVNWLGGNGLVRVGQEPGADASATWTGKGASASLTDPDNWGGTAPDFTAGTLVASFPAGAQVEVPSTGTYWFRGLNFGEGDGNVRLTGGLVRLGSGGVAISGTARTVTIGNPIVFDASATIDVGANTLVFSETAVLSAAGADVKITVTGTGKTEVRSSNPNLSQVDASGEIHVYADNALGGPFARFRQIGDTAADVLVLHGCRLDCAIDITAAANRLMHLQAFEGDNVLCGAVTAADVNEGQYGCKSAATLTFRGGVTYVKDNAGASWSPTTPAGETATVTVEGAPMNVRRVGLGSVDGNIDFRLNVASNCFPRGLVFRDSGTGLSVLKTGVPYALYADGNGGVTFAANAENAQWDLCGCDQAVSVYFSRTPHAVVTSEMPATLHLVDDRLNYLKLAEPAAMVFKDGLLGTASQVDRTEFAGAAGFSKDGLLTHYMMGVSTSTGCVAVTKGTLVFTKASAQTVALPQEQEIAGAEATEYVFTPLTGSWRTATGVSVSGGTLKLEHGRVFGAGTDVKVFGNGMIDLADGIVQRCRTLTIDGVVHTEGTWGAVGSGADHTDGHFTGKGVLRIMNGFVDGSILIFR